MTADAWQEELDLRAELKNKPAEASEHEDLLHKANFYNRRAEALEAKGSLNEQQAICAILRKFKL